MNHKKQNIFENLYKIEIIPRFTAGIFILSICVFHGCWTDWNLSDIETRWPKNFLQRIYRLWYAFKDDHCAKKVSLFSFFYISVKSTSKTHIWVYFSRAHQCEVRAWLNSFRALLVWFLFDCKPYCDHKISTNLLSKNNINNHNPRRKV